MPKGISIHIGLNELDERHYGSRCTLAGCLGDVDAMHRLAVSAGFEPTVLRAEEATADAVLGAIRGAAHRVGPEDILLVTYSGHGARVRDLPLDQGGDEVDGWDETWCLYDREVLDDELYDCWGDFPAGARILVVSDSCFSGDIIRDDEGQDALPRITEGRSLWGTEALDETRRLLPELPPVPPASRGTRGGGMRGGGMAGRRLSAKTAKRVYMRNRRTYEEVQKSLPERRPVHAEVLLLSAAQDNETAADGEHNGAFTEALLQVWNDGAFEGDYVALHCELYKRLRTRQHPQILALRPPSFARQRPFTI